MALKYCIGIDIGKSGAIVIQDLETNGILKLKMPIIGKEFDIHKLVEILQEFKNENCFVVFEDLRAIYGVAAGATFTFGHVAGATEATVIALGLRFKKLQAKIWQKWAFIGIPEIRKPSKVNKKGVEVKGGLETKQMALLAAKRMFPNEDLRKSERSKNPDDGIVDALLISEWIKQNIK